MHRLFLFYFLYSFIVVILTPLLWAKDILLWHKCHDDWDYANNQLFDHHDKDFYHLAHTFSDMFCGRQVDVWSAGILYYQMLFGRRPFGHHQTQERILREDTIIKARKVDFPSKPTISNEAKVSFTLLLIISAHSWSFYALHYFFIKGYFANECHALIEESALRCIKNHIRTALLYFLIKLLSFNFLACAVAFILFYYSVMDTTMLLRLYVFYVHFDK